MRLLRSFCLAAALALAGTAAMAQETRTLVDDAGRSVDIPLKPQRIATLHDLYFTVPLIELGVMPVASHGRMGEGGKPFIRSAKALTGVDFDNSPIAFLGTGTEIDPELVAAAEPDLIILSTNQKPEAYSQIAPTVLLDFNVSDKFELYDRLAEVTGTQDRLALLKTRYDLQIANLRRLVDTEAISVNIIGAVEGQVRSYRHFAALGKVLDEAGFALPPALPEIAAGQYADFSPERLQDMDADLILVSYRAEEGETAQDAYDQLEAAVPGYCAFLSACQNGRLIAIPRDETFAASYGALGTLAYTITALTTAPAPQD